MRSPKVATMTGILMATLLAGLAEAGGDWVVVGRLLIDTYCETAHDGVSGVVVRSCASISPPSVDSDDPRLAPEHDEQVGSVRIRMLVYREPCQDVRLLRADIGPEPHGCPVNEFLAAYTPPPACGEELAFLVSQTDRRPYRYDAVVCSAAQRSRAQEYLRGAALGRSNKIIEAGSGHSHGSLAPADLDRALGMSLRGVLATYGQ